MLDRLYFAILSASALINSLSYVAGDAAWAAVWGVLLGVVVTLGVRGRGRG